MAEVLPPPETSGERPPTPAEAESILQQLAGANRPPVKKPSALSHPSPPAPATARAGNGRPANRPPVKGAFPLEQYSALLEAMPDALVIVNRDGQIVLVNSQTEEMFGYRREELLGRPVEVLIPERFQKEHVQDRQDYFTAPQVRPMGVGRELFGRHKDGRDVPVEISLSPLEAEEGTFAVSTIRDVSERKRAEARLHKLEERYRTLVEGIPAVTFMAALDEGLNELYVSPQIEALLGFSQKEWLEDPVLWHRQLHPDDRHRWHEEFAQTCAAGKPFRSVYRFLARDGRVVWVQGAADLVRDDDGRPLFLQGVAFNITGIKEAEEQLKRMNQTLEQRVAERTAKLARSNADLDEFAEVGVHDLKKPLRFVNWRLDNLRERLGDQLDAEARGWMERIFDRTKWMDETIEDLYYYSRLDRDEVKTRPVDCNKLFENVREHLLQDIMASGAKVTVSELPTVEGVGNRLLRVFQNLVGNAIKFRDPGRPIRVHVSAEGRDGGWLFRVADTGIGIEADDVNKLFKKIGVKGRLTHPELKYEGKGLGLGMCKKIVKSHGGCIWVESEWGRGSTFFFTLPVRTPPRPAEPVPVP